MLPWNPIVELQNFQLQFAASATKLPMQLAGLLRPTAIC